MTCPDQLAAVNWLRRPFICFLFVFLFVCFCSTARAEPGDKTLPLPGTTFAVAKHQAFVMLPAEPLRRNPQPWIWYAPTLPGLPDEHEKWMHERFLAAGVAVAGIDVGESFGNKAGRQLFSDLYEEMTRRRGFATKPVMLGRSRGGLMITNWAVEHPDLVAGIAGIYPVFDFRSWPGVATAAPAYEMSPQELAANSKTLNPIERADALVKARVPVFLIHGDVDETVPLAANSVALAKRYAAQGADDLVRLVVAKGQGHNYWEGFFRCQELIDFAIARATHDWSQFRGPDGQGVAFEGKLPNTWGEDAGLVWRAPIPGRGWSSPVIEGDLCWMTTAIAKEATPEQREEILKTKLASNPLAKEMEIIDSVSLRAVAVDLQTGKVVRNVELFNVKEPEPIHSLNSYASPTPVLKNGKLCCHFGTWGTACLETKTGLVSWRIQLPVGHSVGPGSSIIAFDNLLIVPCDGTDTQSVVALNTADGEIAWRTNRPKMTGEVGDMHKAFSSPLAFHDGVREQVVVIGAQWVVSYSPRDGQPLWQVRHGEGFSNVPSPIYSDGVVYICTGYMNPELVAIRVDGSGDVTESHVLWRINKQVPAMSSPILVRGRIYMVSDQGVVTCADAKTGEVIFRERIAGNHSVSPMFVDGRILFLSRQGDATLLAAGDKFNIVSKTHLEGQLMSNPAVWGDSLLIRSDTNLYRFGDKP